MFNKNECKEIFKNYIKDNGYDPVAVAKLGYKLFSNKQSEISLELRDKLIDIFTMEEGPEFEMTESEFIEFIENM